MNRTITVKGTGNIKVAPDLVEIRMKLASEDCKYEVAMSNISRDINMLNEVLFKLGFRKGDLKTTNFDVQTSYRSVKDRIGNYNQVFNGYKCRNDLKLTFDLDSERLSRVLCAISESNVQPDISIHFTVKNPADASDALLHDAAQNGMRKARVLCDASGAKLGQLISISYNWGELNIYSDASITGMMDCASTSCEPRFSAQFDPEEISLSDTVTMIWEIQ